MLLINLNWVSMVYSRIVDEIFGLLTCFLALVKTSNPAN